MAAKRKSSPSKKKTEKKMEESMVVNDPMIQAKPALREQKSSDPEKMEKKDEEWGEPLDPQEEKVLDWILKGVVIFILGWLGLSILLVIGGYFGLWK